MAPPLDTSSRTMGALAIRSPSSSPSPASSPRNSSHHVSQPSWSRRQSSTSQSRPRAAYAKAAAKYKTFSDACWTAWRGLSLWQKIALVAFIVFLDTFIVLFFVYNEAIMKWLQPRAVEWSKRSGGWVLIWFFVFITAFPPLIGYSTSITMCGFIYGVWPGWLIAATGNIAGSTAAFFVCRYYLHDWIERKVAHDKRFQALALVLKHDGLKLLTMIRLCPLPYSLSNGALSTFPTVSVPMFAAATALACPKLLLHVFIGSKFADVGEGRGDKTLDYVSIAFGSALGIATGWIIYRRTQARSRQLEAEEQAKLMEDGRGGAAGGALDGDDLEHPDAFLDDGTEDLDDGDTAVADDEIDFLGSPATERPYMDDHSEDEALVSKTQDR